MVTGLPLVRRRHVVIEEVVDEEAQDRWLCDVANRLDPPRNNNGFDAIADELRGINLDDLFTSW